MFKMATKKEQQKLNYNQRCELFDKINVNDIVCEMRNRRQYTKHMKIIKFLNSFLIRRNTLSNVFPLGKLVFNLSPTMAPDFLSGGKSPVIFFISLPVAEYETTKALIK